MASELDTICAICLDSWEEDAASVLPCLHCFCYMCIRRWADRHRACPLCKQNMSSIVHGLRDDGSFEEDIVAAPAAPAALGRQAGAAAARPAAHRPAAAAARAAEGVPGAAPGGLRPSAWAALFTAHPALLQPVRAWLRLELRRIFGRRHSRAEVVEVMALPLLAIFGLDAEVLRQLLLAPLGDRTEAFVRDLIDAAVQCCSEEAMRLLGLEGGPAADPVPAADPRPAANAEPAADPRPAADTRTAADSRRGSALPAPASSVSQQGSNAEDMPSTSAAARRGGPASPPSAPFSIRGQPAEPQQDAEPGPSTSDRGTERSRGGPRRPPRRRAAYPSTSPSSKRKPPDRQH